MRIARPSSKPSIVSKKKKDDKTLDANARFYLNKTQSKPRGALIEEILKNWYGDYRRLESHHGYIQWLFPNRDDGRNKHAQELQLHEIETICGNSKAHARVLKAYQMMLDFYGMKLKNQRSGKIERARNWKDRFQHLNKSHHNYLRITRILKCLGDLKYEHLVKPFIEFILHEAIVEHTLSNLLDSCCSYWIDLLRNAEREEVWKLFESLSETQTKKISYEKHEGSKKEKKQDESKTEQKTEQKKVSAKKKAK
ncbi:hypothetical protein CHS0354_031891 [Potamilus streckersoni]|uniref:Opioid growth factor receptor (OGFr) conserved domain-containing protein n=1 Tax=Potamilus streckersoni TaxID=2493646 RepID=A0AAE0VL15_9BIVA|nr:hypothetical protein CHS0354_031891 [Potamilus streckersoni]